MQGGPAHAQVAVSRWSRPEPVGDKEPRAHAGPVGRCNELCATATPGTVTVSQRDVAGPTSITGTEDLPTNRKDVLWPVDS